VIHIAAHFYSSTAATRCVISSSQ